MSDMNSATTVVWFRQDLRMTDNPALTAAAGSGAAAVPVFIWDDGCDRDTGNTWVPGGAARWWLHHSLASLDTDLRRLGSRLVLRRGPALPVLTALIAETGARRVVWNRCYEPAALARDTAIKQRLKADGIAADSFNSALLCEPWTLEKATGGPFRVYTPFWRACRDQIATAPPVPLPPPEALTPPERWPDSDALADLGLLPRPDWAGGLREAWTPGEADARARLGAFLDTGLAAYGDLRNRPDLPATSSLSPHLHWGEIGPRQIWHAVHARLAAGALPGREGQAETFLKELVWREFSYQLLFHFPDLPDRPLSPRFDDFPWAPDDGVALTAWQRGRTGYPIVDAGMRQLWHIGWMHNRVRMIVASFLTKHLLQPWQYGEAWFWDTLVDADLANNAASWQWVAGCGADAAPFFRIFNPILQGEKFDPDGAYVRRWVPELGGLANDVIHKPWRAKPLALEAAGLRFGRDYPLPIIDHDRARRRALAAFASSPREATTR